MGSPELDGTADLPLPAVGLTRSAPSRDPAAYRAEQMARRALRLARNAQVLVVRVMEEGAEGSLQPDEGVELFRRLEAMVSGELKRFERYSAEGHAALLAPATESRNAAEVVGRLVEVLGGLRASLQGGGASDVPELRDDLAEIRQQLLMETELAR